MVSHGALRAYARSFLRFAAEPEYRRVSALSARFLLYPRRRPSSIHIDGKPFVFPDAASFLSAYEEIFADQIYKFRAQTSAPVILDLGANVGVSVLYFKRTYPAARVIAYEPDPAIFSYLERNVRTYDLRDVDLHNEAVWTEDAELSFSADGADGGQLSQNAGALKVKARAVASVMDLPRIDFLKMDIEGAENQVLPAAAPFLSRVQNVFVEYHSRSSEPQSLDKIMSALASAGFRITVSNLKHRVAPLIPDTKPGDFDLQLNVFGYRP